MDLSFALQALSAEYPLKHKDSLQNKVYDVPEEIDLNVAKIFLNSNGIRIDESTQKQIEYLTKPH